MDREIFLKLLRDTVNGFDGTIRTEDWNWVVKGFIDVYKNIYTISADTKVVSKIIELYIFPKILEFATQNELEIELTNGNGTFAELGEDIFNDYWMYYLTVDMAKKAELPKPYYSNLAEYKQFKQMGVPNILTKY